MHEIRIITERCVAMSHGQGPLISRYDYLMLLICMVVLFFFFSNSLIQLSIENINEDHVTW